MAFRILEDLAEIAALLIFVAMVALWALALAPLA
jgi:hypothetical protein